SDFRHSHLLRGQPSRLLAIVTGNVSNTDLLGLFNTNIGRILSALDESSFVELGVKNADGPGQVRRRSAYHGSPIGASAVQSRRKTSRGSRLRHRQRRREKANIRANKPVPERRTQLHAVAQEPRDDYLDETKCDGAGQSDTSSDTMELPTDQKV